MLYLDSFYELTGDHMPERLHLAKVRQPDPGRLQLTLMRPFTRRMYQQMFASWPEPVRRQLIGTYPRSGGRSGCKSGATGRSSQTSCAAAAACPTPR